VLKLHRLQLSLFFYRQKTANELLRRLVASEMFISA